MIVFRVTRSQGVPNGLYFDNTPSILGIVGGVMGRMRGSAVAATGWVNDGDNLKHQDNQVELP